MFESLVSQVAGRFGLTDEKTKQLLGMLIGLVFNEKRGGPTAFLQSFRDKGMGDVVASWLGTGDNLPINGSQISNVLGSELINSFGNRLGLPGATISDASAALLPTAIATMASDGKLELGALDRIKGWFGSLWDDGDDAVRSAAAYGTGAVAATAAVAANAADKVTDKVSDAADRVTGAAARTASNVAAETKSGGGLWKWLLPLLAILLALWAFRSCSTDTTTDATTTEPTTEQSADQVATDANAAAAAAGDAATDAAGSAAAAIAAAEKSARDAFARLTAESPIADFKAALDLVPIQFDTGSATIKAESNAILDDAAKTLKLLKAGTTVEVQGHTDSDGDDNMNLKLSQDRADSVKAALVQRGVSADMLTTKGYGETNPIGDNATAEGKAKNRRIAYDIK